MFERYTERARRVIFYARYEASQYGSPYIETEHLLLGLLREDFATVDLLIPGCVLADRIRKRIESEITARERISTSIEVPLAEASKRVLNRAAEEAEKCGHRHIGTEHLLLGLLRVEEGLAYRILSEHKPDLIKVQERVRKMPRQISASGAVVSGWKAFSPQTKEFQGPQQFLECLRAGNWQELSELFAEQSFFVDTKGKLWSGRKEISSNLQNLLSPFATKKARHHLEAARSGNPAIWMGTILWEHILMDAKTTPSIVRMTLIFMPEKGTWLISSLQLTDVDEAPSVGKAATT